MERKLALAPRSGLSLRVVESADARVELFVALEEVLVLCVRLRVGGEGGAFLVDLLEGVLFVLVDAGADAGEGGGAEGDGFLDVGDLDGFADDVGLGLHEEAVVGGASDGDDAVAADGHVLLEGLHDLEGLVVDALDDGAEHVAADTPWTPTYSGGCPMNASSTTHPPGKLRGNPPCKRQVSTLEVYVPNRNVGVLIHVIPTRGGSSVG